MSADLVAFLEARIAEDEVKVEHMQREMRRVRTAPIFGPYRDDLLASLQGIDIFVSPDRWKAECVAKRKIVAAYADLTEFSVPGQIIPRPGLDIEGAERLEHELGIIEPLVYAMAEIYASHPDYQKARAI